MNRVKEFFTTNLAWKIGALFLAFALWFVVLNIEDPYKTVEVPLTLQLKGEETFNNEKIILENKASLSVRQISVYVRGNTKTINELKSRWSAYIDLGTSDIIYGSESGGALKVNVNIEGIDSSKIELLSIKPSSVELNLDSIITKSIAVHVEPIGSVDANYRIDTESIEADPKSVKVTGPSNTISRIDQVLIEVPVEGKTNDVLVTQIPKAIDIRGDEIALEIEKEIKVTVPIDKKGKLTILKPKWQSDPPEGYVVTGIDWDPKDMDVAGDEDAINALAAITLDPVAKEEVENAKGAFSVKYNINGYLPENVYLVKGSNNTITVTVKVEKLAEKAITIPISEITVVGLDSKMQTLSEEVHVTVAGVESVIAKVEKLAGSIDLTGLAPGEHDVPVKLALDAGVSLVGDVPAIKVIIGDLPDIDSEIAE